MISRLSVRLSVRDVDRKISLGYLLLGGNEASICSKEIIPKCQVE